MPANPLQADHINAPLDFPSGQRIANRLAKAAMTEGLADEHGRPGESLIRLYDLWARSGCGILITGNVQVDRNHLERGGNVVIDREPDAQMQSLLARWAAAGKSQGAQMWMQISHAGRQTPRAINPHPKAPSAIKLAMPGNQFGNPVALTDEEIEVLIERFVVAARAAEAAGFDGAQVHAAHGYLISTFLSPKANRRTDRWGDDLAGRARFLMKTVKRIRASVSPGFGLSVKLNSADFQRGGFELEESEQVAAWLDGANVDLIEISGGTYEAPKMMNLGGEASPAMAEAQRSTRSREAYFAAFAPRIRKHIARARLMVTGGFRSAAAMNDALANDGIDIIGVGRPLCVEPDAVSNLLAGRQNALPRIEDHLRLGPGFLAPTSRFQLAKLLNAASTQAWYYEQLVRFGDGKDTDRSLGLLKALVKNRRRDAQTRTRAR